MFKLFEYNWQVRNDWFDWCRSVEQSELLQPRIGGLGSMLYTLYHIIDVEYSWISDMQQKRPEKLEFAECMSVDRLQAYSAQCHKDILPFVRNWNGSLENNLLHDVDDDTGEPEVFKYGEAMRHVIAHEIHHIGQLSIWAREIGKRPITANLIRRGLFE